MKKEEIIFMINIVVNTVPEISFFRYHYLIYKNKKIRPLKDQNLKLFQKKKMWFQ